MKTKAHVSKNAGIKKPVGRNKKLLKDPILEYPSFMVRAEGVTFKDPARGIKEKLSWDEFSRKQSSRL